jgi:hypothetical protein
LEKILNNNLHLFSQPFFEGREKIWNYHPYYNAENILAGFHNSNCNSYKNHDRGGFQKSFTCLEAFAKYGTIATEQ